MNIFRKFRKKYRKIPLKRISILICTLIMTTVAWFTFSQTLQTGINLHINSWNIRFYEKNGQNLNQITGSTVKVEFSDLYPTMENQEKEIVIENNGEVNANITYSVESINMIGIAYTPVQSLDYATQNNIQNYIIPGTAVETNEDDNFLEIDYINDPDRFPFTLTLKYPKKIALGGGTGTVTITFSWLGTDESKNELDSVWGYNIAKYLQSNTDGVAIELVLKINVNQSEE